MTEETQEYREPTPAEKKKIQKEMQKHYNHFKNRFKTKTKSELTAIIWEQGLEFKKLQDIAKELYEENKLLKKEDSSDEN